MFFDSDSSNAAARKDRWLVFTNKPVTPIRMNVICNQFVESGNAWIVGSGAQMGGAGKIAPVAVEINIGSPAWTPTSPLIVTITHASGEIACSFNVK